VNTHPAHSVAFRSLLRDTLNAADTEYVSLGYENPGESWHVSVLPAAEVIHTVDELLPTGADAFFGVNPVKGPARRDTGHRGTAAAVTRFAALFADLDIKPKSCPTLDVARDIIAELSKIIGTRPSAITHSGGGLHPYWPVDPDDPQATDITVTGPLLRRWGRLVAVVADAQGVKTVDNVYDLPRMLRVPGTHNSKNGAAVTCDADSGHPLTIAEIDERLTEYGIVPRDEDANPSRDIISAPDEWVWAEETTCYVATMITCWRTDKPKRGQSRNPWFYDRYIRLECAHRLGWITEADHADTLAVLARRLLQILKDPKIGKPRQPRKGEIRDWRKCAIAKAASKTDKQARDELGAKARDETPTGADEIEVDEPVPLTGNPAHVPPFPVNALPDVYANKVVELAEATQTDPAMAGVCALVILSACVGGHARIQARPGWIEPLNLYTCTIAKPGERKSAVQASMVCPLHEAETELGLAGETARLEQQDRRDFAEKEVDRLNGIAVNAAAKAAKSGKPEDKAEADRTAEAARAAKAAMRDIEVPETPRLLADDTTPEMTATLLDLHGGRIAIISAEGGIWDRLAGLYSHGKTNIDVYLKGHAGDPIRVDRIGRQSDHIPAPALTLGLMVQPRIIEIIATNRDFTGRGLLARFLSAQPPSKVGSRRIEVQAVSMHTETRYNAAVKALANDMTGWQGDPALLILSPDAQRAIGRLQARVEPMLADDGEFGSSAGLIEWGSKFVGAVVRIAGLLHFGQHGESGHKVAVSVDTITAAEQIGAYFKATAVNLFAWMANPDVADAIYLLDRAVSLNADEVSERDLFTNSSRPRFPTMTALKPAVERLVEHGYLIPVEQVRKPGAAGRPGSPRYRVHSASAAAVANIPSRVAGQ
jgi:replicative DNA helicase